MTQDEDVPFESGVNHAGVGAGGGPLSRGALTEADLSRSATHKLQRSQVNGINGHAPPSCELSVQQQAQAQQAQRCNSTASGLIHAPSHSYLHSQTSSATHAYPQDPVDPTISGMQLTIRNKAWDVDPSKDPQQQTSSPNTTQATSHISPPIGIGAGDDLLVKQMAELSTAAAATKGPERQNTIHRDTPSLRTSLPSGGQAIRGPINTCIQGYYGLSNAAILCWGILGIYVVWHVRLVYASVWSWGWDSATINLGQSPQQMQQMQRQDLGPRSTSRAGYPGIGMMSLAASAPLPAHGMSPGGGIGLGAVQLYGKARSLHLRASNKANSHTSAHGAITSHVTHAMNDVMPVIQNMLITILMRTQQLLGMQIVRIDDWNKLHNPDVSAIPMQV
ncbi:hypothetical protein PISMIDRAFT_25640 [Pisolithus microcarpus 441]|uniref:Importin subunit beta-1/Transportin-1-like TPR repeats domain-containing protein n=1 Tax=Pisolithus microcarpus 441 TaxID=765257 RepID=A0A0C9YF95_9AGAM|nr:hypothetical protein BKA83DRAFT_25640 [Pisolithus microcarpus]KIK12589.1 hypothetical protein PISMIDRAFT_25640 [Pisolithus microcarpus 441]